MKRNKRWIAAALVVMLLLNTFPGDVFAADLEMSSQESVATEIEEEPVLGDDTIQKSEETETEEEPAVSDNSVNQSEITEAGEEDTVDETVTPEPQEEIPEKLVEDSEEDNNQSVAAQLQARIDALPDLETWNMLCENQNEEYVAINAEIAELCKAIQDTYGLHMEADDFDPSGDYSVQCPLDLTKLIAILYPEPVMQESTEMQIRNLPEDDAFNQMCIDIFGKNAGEISTDSNYTEVYVGSNGGGEQTGTPGTPEKPYGSLEAAYSGVAGKSGAVIHLMESYKDVQDGISFWPDTNVPVIIISEAYDSAVLNMSAVSWDFRANTGFYNVQINLTYDAGQNSVMYANGHTLIFGGHQKNNFAFRNDSAVRSYPTLFGAGGEHSGTSSQHGQVSNTNLKVYGGTWSQIFGGGNKYSDVTGKANVLVDGSYLSENNGIQPGAVTFSDAHLAYMEGSSHIYGGGAGDFTLLSASENSNVNVSEVNLGYLTTNKYVTPCGSWMGASASITLDHVTAKGVNARSEGKAAENVDLIIKNSIINEKVGSLGSTQKDVTSAYIYANQISDFNITIEGSDIKGTVAVKSGGLSGAEHNHSVTGVNLILKNSTVGTLAMAELPAEYNKGTVDLIHLENSSIKKYFSSANFGTIKKIDLIRMKDFEWNEYLFSAKYNPSNAISETLCVEDTNVHFKIPYETGNLSVTNGTITLDSDLTLNVESYTGGAGSKLEMHDGSSMIVSGTVSGIGTTVMPMLKKENSAVQITWKRANGSDNLNFFTRDTSSDFSEKKAYVPTMNMCYWYNYKLEENAFIYVDGQNGHDSTKEYSDSECTDATLGYDSRFPVKTLGKAYDLCKSEEEKIVVCGPYEIQVSEQEQELPLIENSQDKSFPVTITSIDDFFDYRGQAYIKFVGTGQSGRLDLKEELIFDNIDFLTQLPEKRSMRIFSNGHKTVYGAGVTAKTVSDAYLDLYGGAYKAGVTSTDLSVQALNVNRVSAGGFGSGAYVGDSQNTEVNKKVVAKLDVNLTQKYSVNLNVDFSGTAYGSVKHTFNFNNGSLANLYFYYQPNQNNTIHGDFITELSSDQIGGTIYAYASPSGQTVQGKVQFTDSGKNYYRYLYLGTGTYQDVNIDIKSNVGDLELFRNETNAKNINWKLSGNVNSVCGTNDNQFLKEKKMQLNVELDATGNTMIKAGASGDTDPSNTGYSQLENVSVTLKNFDVSNTISSLQGFGSVTFDHCLCMVNAELYTTKLSVVNSSKINCMQKIAVGQENNKGELSLLSSGCMVVNNALLLEGDMVGENEKISVGTLENNWANDQDETEQITVKGTVTGHIYYTTSYEKAKIQVTGNTTGTEYMVPKAAEGVPGMTIECEPDSNAGSQPNRIWTTTNPVSKKVIFVNGSVDKSNYSTHDGSTPGLAYATLEEGYEDVLNGGTIVICGDTVVSSWPVNPKAVTITSKRTIGTGENAISYDYFSKNGSASFSIEQTSVELKNDTVFEYLNIKNSQIVTIGACGNKLTMGHLGDEESLKMFGKPLNVGGGTNTTQITEGINTDVTIYAGIYGTASGTNSCGNTGNYTKYFNVKIQIFGGVFDKIFVKGNLYDSFSNMTNSPVLTVENAEVKTSIYAAECNFTVGSKPYQINIGKDMIFSENAMIVAGTYRANYGEKLSTTLNIDGSGGKTYKIPVISTGKSQGNDDIKDSSATISIKGVTVEKFYGALSANSNISAKDISTKLSLHENTMVKQLYFGGKNTAGKSMIVNVHSDSAIIESIVSGSENNQTEIPETAELNFIDIDKKTSYKLQSGVSLNGLTKVTVRNANLDITNAGPNIVLDTLDASEGNITYRKNVLNLKGNYIGGSEEKPAMFYGWKAPNYTIEGTVSGVTQVCSLAPDPSSENKVTGKFYYGMVIKAPHSDLHTKANFQCLKNNENQELVFSDMTFTSGQEGQMDQWEKEDEEDKTNRTQVFVSTEEGVDSNAGTYVSPVKTISQAYQYIDDLYRENQQKTAWDIVLLDDITFNDTMPEQLSEGYRVTIKSESTANKLIIQDEFHIPVDTTFDNILIKSNSHGKLVEIFANGHKVICSENLKVEAVNGHYPILFGGSDNTSLAETHLTVYGGTWNQIFGGSKNAKVDSSTLIVGKNTDTLHIGTVDEGRTGVFGGGMNDETGSVTLTVEGGSYFRIFGGGMNQNASTGAIDLKIHAGDISRLYGGGQNANTMDNISVSIGKNGARTNQEEEKASITEVYRGSGLYAGLADGKKAVTNIYSNTVISEKTQFAAGGYSGTLDFTELYIHGGTIKSNVYAGGWGEGTEGTYGTVKEKSLIKVHGGAIKGNIYGGGKLAVVKNGSENAVSEVKILGGTIKGNIYGGGNAAGVDNSDVTISSNSNVEGNVFGGSENITSENLQIQKTSKVVLNSCTVTGSVFGGSDTSGLISNTVEVTTQGKVRIAGEGNGIYGGGSKAPLKIAPTVTIPVNAQVTGNIYGGGKGEVKGLLGRAANLFSSFISLFNTTPSYNISGLEDANVPSTNVNIAGTVTGNVYGGGERATVGNSENTTWNTDVTHIILNEGATVQGNIYGGGKGQSGKEYAVIYGNTKVELQGGSVTVDGDEEDVKTAGAVFGGSEIAPVAGNTNIMVHKGSFSNIFGGNDVEGEVLGETSVEVPLNSQAKITHVYGGGRDAAHRNTNKVTVQAGTVTEVYGGGYGVGANSSETKVSIKGGTITSVYGGGNAAPAETAKAIITGGTVDAVYAGGNAATVTKHAEVVVNTTDMKQHINVVYAGNNAAAMNIQPTLTLTKGKIGSVYCGGNAGVMNVEGGLTYDFDYPEIQIDTLYAGCNDTVTAEGDQAETSDVALKLISGQYGTVYGGNNAHGYMANSKVTIAKAEQKNLTLNTVYGGGNRADAKNTHVTLTSGEVKEIYGGGNLASVVNSKISLEGGTSKTVYGGGNNATVTGSVSINAPKETNNAVVTDLYCGNNAADMSIAPVVDFKGITITNFYGGGNKGRMTAHEINYSLSGTNTKIETAFGGCNQADVEGNVIMNLAGATVATAYGGCNTSGKMRGSVINVTGGAGTVYGGGKGENTTVTTTHVNLQNGTINGNVYGGSGYGTVKTSYVTAQESGENAKVAVLGDVFGAGYGQSSSVTDTNVRIALNLNITDNANDTSADVQVSETAKDINSASGESSAKATWLNNKTYQDVSYIGGNVFGGGDMGQIGSGYINNSTNTAVINTEGSATVSVSSGYIDGNVFGGGNGQPASGIEYNTYMGTVFGTSKIHVTGGYVNGNLFGCGQQSRTYAASDKDGDKSGNDASYVIVEESFTNTPILIGGSIFGGGNKGNGSTQNASVATVYGETHVKITGKEGSYTQIYMLSDGDKGGGVYGDGNLCLVSGKKYVTLSNFSCGKKNTNLLKTFYSLQRADVVDLTGSRIVLKGAVDLVAENVDDTRYSINRVGQLNLKESSTIKLVQTVNLLAELTSDEQPERQFINKGNNNGNAYVSGNNYTAHGGTNPSNPLSVEEAKAYINAYKSYYGTLTAGEIPASNPYHSINVVCVANGGYLEVKKSAAEYGAVTGLYTLQLLNAVPGEGGGFVYASIDGKKISEDTYATGNFVCVTKDGENSDDYMIAYHDVGGNYENSSKKYEYYLWYLKGNQYHYDVDVTGYIGTTDTKFQKSISLPVETESQELMLATMTQSKDVQGLDLKQTWKNTWEDSDHASDKIALELELVKNVKDSGSIKTEATSIGFIGYKTGNSEPNGDMELNTNSPNWGIWRRVDGQWKFQESECSGENQTSMNIDPGDTLGSFGGVNVVNAQLRFTLHKGNGMTTEFKNLPFEMMIAEVKTSDYTTKKSVDLDSCVRLIDDIRLSAIRLVPTQAAYIGSGRLFAGVSSSTNVDITKTSAFTAQFVTKYIPSAFNTGTVNNIKETLVTSYHDIYLVDEKGVGYRISENPDGSIDILNKTNVSDPSVTNYTITKENGTYKVTYTKADASLSSEEYACTATVREGGFIIPKGTVITLLASLDDGDATYWYYYCKENKTEIPLEEFKQMNTSESTKSSSTVYDTIFSNSSSRITENMIFVFDFSNVTSSEWGNIPLNGDIMLKHTYNKKHDIMEYISAEKQSDDSIQYVHETPKATSTFEFSQNSDGISSFTVSNANDESADNPIYYQNDMMDFALNINPDTSTTNTRYEEREYAVILTLRENEKEIPFPEGTTATYDGKQLIAGTENKYFIVPVKTVGTHQVTVTTGLRGLAVGSYNLKGALYSTSATGYYNSITVTHEADKYLAPFNVQANPKYTLKVAEGNGTGVRNHLAKSGQNFDFIVTANAENGINDSVKVNLYRYHTSGSEQGKYQKILLSSIFEGTPDLSEVNKKWNPKVVQNAAPGTYRLEFQYGDKTEYWDFIIS